MSDSAVPEEHVIGVGGIAARLNLSRQYVGRLSELFDDWPEPRGYLTPTHGGPGSSPWYDWRDIEAFLHRHPQIANSWGERHG